METAHKASRVFSFPWPTKMLMPDQAKLGPRSMTITKKTLFGISSTVEEVDYERISSVRTVMRVFTAAVVVETYGGAIADLSLVRMTRPGARRMAEQVRMRLPSAAPQPHAPQPKPPMAAPPHPGTRIA